MSKPGKIAALSGGLLALFMLLTLGLTLTAPGQRALLGAALWAASSKTASFSAQGLEGELFSDGRISRLTVADEQGVWGEFEEISFSWSPRSLLGGTLEIARAEIGRVEIRRTPADAGSGESGGNGDPVPAWLKIPPMRIGGFVIRETSLGEPLLGRPARLSVSAQIDASDPGRAIFGSLAVRDLDAGGRAELGVTWLAAGRRFDIALSAQDEAGGLLASMLDLDEAVNLSLNGTGPAENWRGEWSMISGSGRIASGNLSVHGKTDDLQIAASASGDLARLTPEPYATLLAGGARLEISARISENYRYYLRNFRLDAPRIEAVASGSLFASNNAIAGEAEFRLRGDGPGAPLVLPLAGGLNLSLDKAQGRFAAAPKTSGTLLSGSIEADGLETGGNAVSRLSLDLSALQPDSVASLFSDLEALSIRANADIGKLADPSVMALAGERIEFKLDGAKSGQTLSVTEAALTAAAGQLSAEGVLDEQNFEGKAELSIPDAGVLSQVAGRELRGGVSLHVRGRAGFDGAFDLAIDGRTEGIQAGDDMPGAVFAGDSTLTGQLARDGEGGLRFRAIRLATIALNAEAEGRIGAEASDFALRGEVDDLGLALPGSSGALTFKARLDGRGAAQSLTAELSAPEAMMRGQPLRGVIVRYEGTIGSDDLEGKLSADGDIGGAPLSGSGEIRVGDGSGIAISDFVLALGGNRMRGDLALPRSGSARGTMQAEIADTAKLAALIGADLDGDAAVTAQISGSADDPELALNASSSRLRIGSAVANDLAAAFAVDSLFASPVLSGRLTLGGLETGDVRVDGVTVSAAPQDEGTDFAIGATVNGGWRFSANALAAFDGLAAEAVLRNMVIRNEPAVLAQDGQAAISLTVNGGRLDGLAFRSGEGRAVASVAIGDEIEGRAELTRFPANFAALFAPGLAPGGAIDGVAEFSGATGDPKASYRLTWSGATLPGHLPPGFPALNLSASGEFADDDLTCDGALTGPGGLDIRITGSLRDATANPWLDMNAAGSAPLALAEPFLGARGSRFSGATAIDLNVSGAPDRLDLNGRFTGSGAAVTDPALGLSLADVSFTASLAGKTLRIEALSARSEMGGAMTAGGTLGVLESGSLPVDLRIAADGFRFDDRRIVSGEIGGNVALEGDLLGKARLSGNADIARLDIRIPQSMPASVQALELKHRNAPDHVQAMLTPSAQERREGRRASIALALDITSANRIFLTGRGLDALLGGELKLQGTADQPRAIGEFTLQRGSMAVLGRALAFTSGSVSYDGDFDPMLNFLAETDVENVRIEVTLTGKASNPRFGFASSPELPEDEILALLLFNKSLANLSAFQIAQLASEISELTGLSSGPGVLGRLKSGLGVDTLNITSDEDGEAAISAGSYLNENVFVGVEQGSSGDSSRVKVDLDITENLKLRGETGADGESRLGVGVEWEY